MQFSNERLTTRTSSVPGDLPVAAESERFGDWAAVMRRLPSSKRQVVQATAEFVAATAGRNMTTAAYVAVVIGVAVMVLLTVAPAYEAAHHWVDGVLWACWAYFAVEWAVRLRHARTAAACARPRG